MRDKIGGPMADGGAAAVDVLEPLPEGPSALKP